MGRKRKKRTKRTAGRKRRVLNKRNYKLKFKKGTSQLVGALASLAFAGIIAASYFPSLLPVPQALVDFVIRYFAWARVGMMVILFDLSLILVGLRNRLTHPRTLMGLLLGWLATAALGRMGEFGLSIWLSLTQMASPAAVSAGLILAVIVAVVLVFDPSPALVRQAMAAWLWLVRQSLWLSWQIVRQIKSRLGLKSLPHVQVQPSLPAADTEMSLPAPAEIQPPELVNQPAAEFVNFHQPSQPKASSGLAPASAGSQQSWQLPTVELLEDEPEPQIDRKFLAQQADVIEQTLDSFNIQAKVRETNVGPSIIQFQIEVAQGTKLSKVTNLSQNLALNLQARNGQIRIEAPIPGKPLVGIEVPNPYPQNVRLKPIIGTGILNKHQSKLAVVLGKDVHGQVKVIEIDKLPHLLIAGATGSGKSVCINSLLASILFRSTPDDVRMILVDPKRVEMMPYSGLPHLHTEVITEPKKVVQALRWCVQEMNERLHLLSQSGVRNIADYNLKVGPAERMPRILFVIDELNEIMLSMGQDVNKLIAQVAQMARAAGIHLVLATQRPDVKVITGVIKANIPARVAFAVTSATDSRVILDKGGAEKLLGKGDMLYMSPTDNRLLRLQGLFLSDNEINRIIDHWRQQIRPGQETQVLEAPGTRKLEWSEIEKQEQAADMDDLIPEVLKFILSSDKASTSSLQTRFRIGYNRASRIMHTLEQLGIVGPQEGSKPREINREQAMQYLNQA